MRQWALLLRTPAKPERFLLSVQHPPAPQGGLHAPTDGGVAAAAIEMAGSEQQNNRSSVCYFFLFFFSSLFSSSP